MRFRYHESKRDRRYSRWLSVEGKVIKAFFGPGEYVTRKGADCAMNFRMYCKTCEQAVYANTWDEAAKLKVEHRAERPVHDCWVEAALWHRMMAPPRGEEK